MTAQPGNQHTYNPRDQVTATRSNNQTVPFTYAGATNNQRLTAGPTSYQNTVLGQTSQATAGQVTATTRTPSGGLVSQRTSTGPTATSSYYLTDNQGTVIGMVNDTGTLVAGYAYGPYGEPRTTTGPNAGANPYRWISGYQDPTSGLTKLGYRYYDPRQGRFTQQDPAGQEANAYLYAAGDPINYTDLFGLYTTSGCSGSAKYCGDVVETDPGCPFGRNGNDGCTGSQVYRDYANTTGGFAVGGAASGCYAGGPPGCLTGFGAGVVGGLAVSSYNALTGN